MNKKNRINQSELAPAVKKAVALAKIRFGEVNALSDEELDLVSGGIGIDLGGVLGPLGGPIVDTGTSGLVAKDPPDRQTNENQ